MCHLLSDFEILRIKKYRDGEPFKRCHVNKNYQNLIVKKSFSISFSSSSNYGTHVILNCRF